jgi:hypothetical protein
MRWFRNIPQFLFVDLLAASAALAQTMAPVGPPGANPPSAPPQTTSNMTTSWVLWVGLLALAILITVIVWQLRNRRRRKRATIAATFGPPGMYTSQTPGFTTSPSEPSMPHSAFPSIRGVLSALWLRRR